MKDYDLNDLLIDEKEGDTSPYEIHYASYQNFVKVFTKNYELKSRARLIEAGALLVFIAIMWFSFKALRPVYRAYGIGATIIFMILASMLVLFLLDLFIKHYIYKFDVREVNDAMREIFKILDTNGIVLTPELEEDLLTAERQRKDFNQLVQSAVMASAIFGLIVSVFDYFTNLRDPNVENNPGLYIEVIALSLFTISTTVAIIVALYALVTDMRKRILFNEAIEAINLNKHIKKSPA